MNKIILIITIVFIFNYNAIQSIEKAKGGTIDFGKLMLDKKKSDENNSNNEEEEFKKYLEIDKLLIEIYLIQNKNSKVANVQIENKLQQILFFLQNNDIDKKFRNLLFEKIKNLYLCKSQKFNNPNSATYFKIIEYFKYVTPFITTANAVVKPMFPPEISSIISDFLTENQHPESLFRGTPQGSNQGSNESAAATSNVSYPCADDSATDEPNEI